MSARSPIPPKGWPDDDPVWSPDGQSIVFNREKIDEGTSRLGLVNPDTDDTREITQCTGRCVYNFNPTFSPDGRSIAFHRTFGPFVPKGEPRKTPVWKLYGPIVISGLDGNDPRQLTETPKRHEGQLTTEVNEPAISPDGKRLGFIRTRYEPEENTAVFVQPIDSPDDVHQLTPWKLNCQERPEFSPDGELMLFRCLPKGEEGPANLYWVHPDGTGLHPLTHEENADKQYLGSSFSPSFSEGEGWIAVGRTGGYGEDGNADVFRILIEDGEIVREVNLTRSAEWESNPNWGHAPTRRLDDLLPVRKEEFFMRRTILLLDTIVLTLVVSAGVALAVHKVGTQSRDFLKGTDGADHLVGKGDSDRIFGLAGKDSLVGELMRLGCGPRTL